MLRAVALLCCTLPSLVFSQTVTFSRSQVASKGTPFAQADLNGDGITDIVSVTVDPNIKSGFYVMLSKSGGGYSPPTFYTSPYPSGAVQLALGDFNNDGKVDVAEVEGSDNYYMFLNRGDGTLQSSWNFSTPPGGGNFTIAAADFNRDGKLDLVMEDFNANLKLLYGTGHGTFSAPLVFARAAWGYNLYVGDYDSDGFPDVGAAFAGGCPRCPTEISVFYGDGKGGFSTPTIIDFQDDITFISDNVDGNQFSDFVGASVASQSIVILHGTAARTFNQQNVPLAKPPNGWPPAAADLNGDGIRDLALIERDPATNTYALNVLLGNPDGTYRPEQPGYSTRNLTSVLAGRYNADTKPDLMILKLAPPNLTDGYFEFLRNTTSGAFPSCNPPKASKGIAICSPAPGATVGAPVKFGIAAAFTSPLRKTELWIDGVKMSESFNSYSTYSFLDATLNLSPGTHHAGVYTAAYDNQLQHQTFTFTVSGSAKLQYSVSLFPAMGTNNGPQGQVTVDTAGVATIQLNHAPENTTYSVQFCSAPGQLYPNCFTVGSVTTNGSGNVNRTVPFPTGSWAGDFELAAGGSVQYATSLMEGVASTYYATLQPDSTVNGKGTWFNGTPQPAQDPLTTGFVTLISPHKLQIQVTGAKSLTEYGASQCPIYRGSSCYAVQSVGQGYVFTTDKDGNVTYYSSPGTNIPEDIFYVDNNTEGFGYIAGFSIP